MVDKCVLPSLQITRAQRMYKKAATSAEDVLQVALQDFKMVALSLLLSTEAETVSELACCIACVRSKLEPCIKSGQLYLLPQWRIRHEHMSCELQQMVMQCSASPTELRDAASIYYKSNDVEQTVYNIIGQARSAGAQALLQQRTVHSCHGLQTSCPKQ